MVAVGGHGASRSEEHTSELQSRVDISYAVFCLKKKNRAATPNHAYVTPQPGAGRGGDATHIRQCVRLHVANCRVLVEETLVFGLFFFNDTATTEIYTLSLHDALPIWSPSAISIRARHRSAPGPGAAA